MSNCSVVVCGIKKSENRPNITLHRYVLFILQKHQNNTINALCFGFPVNSLLRIHTKCSLLLILVSFVGVFQENINLFVLRQSCPYSIFLIELSMFSNFKCKLSVLILNCFYCFRLPKNNKKRKIWLDTMRKENLKTRTKTIFMCSFHFEEQFQTSTTV